MSTTLGALAATLMLASPVRADSITLTAGAFNWVAGGGAASVTMSGGDFTFDGVAHSTAGGVFTPMTQCQVPECRAGSTVDLDTRFQGLDLPGTATLDGRTFTNVGGLTADSGMDARWAGRVLIPADFTGGLVVAPFTFEGEFFHLTSPTTGAFLQLFGSGLARLSFSPSSAFPGTFNLESVTYEFEAVPTPEPASMLLLGTGLAGLAAARRRRRSQGLTRCRRSAARP